jgi:hypothetical protein
MDQRGAMVTVGAFTTVTEAEAARLLLDSHGIACVLSDAETISMAWIMSNAVGGVKLLVAEADANRARQLLARRPARRGATDDYGLDAPAPSRSLTAVHQVDDPEEALSMPDPREADDTVDRAWRAAIFGLVYGPVVMHLYSLFLLLQLPWVQSRVSPDHRGRLWVAAAVDALVMLAVIVVLQVWVF